MSLFSPFMRSIVTTGTPTIDSLATLLAAVDANFPKRLMYLTLEFDLAGAGDLYIGNSRAGALLSPTNCGAHIVPAQGANIVAFTTGVILTTDIFLLSSVAAQQVNVTALPIGM